MTTVFNNSFDSSPNSDSDDDFMVDSIISTDCQPGNSESKSMKPNSIPTWIKNNAKCARVYNVKGTINMVSKLPLKRCLTNNLNINNGKERFTKCIKLTLDNNRPVKVINSHRCTRNKYFDNVSMPLKISNSYLNNQYNSNAQSPFTESDKTHSAESSPSCILLNDPIITSVVLNEKRFTPPTDSSSRLPSDDNFFNDMTMSFDKSYYSTSIDDNLLRPMRYNQFFNGSNQPSSGSSTKNVNYSLNIDTFNKLESKLSRSMGFDQQKLSIDRRVRSSDSLEIIKYVPVSVLSEPNTDSTHSSSTATVISNFSRKNQPNNNNGHNKRKHLLQFIIDLLKENNSCVNWSNKKDKEFVISQPDKLALLWATYKNNNKMTFDSLARSLRLYYAPKKLERISGKKNHYRILNLSHEISFNL